MAKKEKHTKAKKETKAAAPQRSADSRVLWSMGHAPSLDQDSSFLMTLPAVLFTAFVILAVRMVNYTRPMDQFYWSAGDPDLTDFFTYSKMVLLLAFAGLALLMLLFKVTTQSIVIKKSYAYIPMAVYSVFVILSYLTSDYKDFALLGYNDRFEGTLPLLAYMIGLFFIINVVNGEKSVKSIIYGLVGSSTLLSLLGISQALDKDFFRTTMGQKLLMPNYMTANGSTTWELVDQAAENGELFLEFTFNNGEIYQTVYNINYVSFYLTLLIPLFGMLFIRSILLGKEEALWKKLGWGVMFALVVFNLIGSASSGGFIGMAAVVLLALLLLNKKILKWWKPVLILLLIAGICFGITVDRWLPELTRSTKSVTSSFVVEADDTIDSILLDETPKMETASTKPVYTLAAKSSEKNELGKLTKVHIDYIITNEDSIDVSIDGNPFSIVLDTEDGKIRSFLIKDAEDTTLPMKPAAEKGVYVINDERFLGLANVAYSTNNGIYYIIMQTYGQDWYFPITENGILYRNAFGNFVDLYDVPSTGFEDNQRFGSGRGYIWSRTIPMMKKTVLMGHGADTYALYFPHNDYVGKYNSGTFTDNINIIVDKPHNMYMGAWIGTGGISVIAFLSLVGMYLVQSIKLYGKNAFADHDFLTFVGSGITFGIFGFLVAGLVNDSSVSVMPMFYGLLGTGIAVNMILAHKAANETASSEA